MLYQMWGTTMYFAPEVYDRAYGYQADIWSLGCMLYEMLTGEVAFAEREVVDNKKKKSWFGGSKGTKGRRSFESHEHYQMLSVEARSLIQGMLHRNPKKRLNIEECLRHPFIVNEGMEEEYSNGIKSARVLPNAHSAIQQRVFFSNEYHEGIAREVERKRAQILQQKRQQQRKKGQSSGNSSSGTAIESMNSFDSSLSSPINRW